MSKEEDDLHEFKRILWDAAEGARTKSGSKSARGVKLMDEVSARFADYSARSAMTQFGQEPVGLVGVVGRTIRRLTDVLQVLQDGPPLPDPLARRFAEDLMAGGKLSRQQLRLVNAYRMIRFEPDGKMDVVVPGCSDYVRGKACIVLIAVLALVLAMGVWELAPEMAGGFSVAYTLGALLGYFIRAAYDSAWGRAKLALHFHHGMPWLNLVVR